jgi:hypothetical protein
VVRHGVEQGPALTRSIAVTLAIVAAFYAVMVPIRIHEHGALWFVHIGDKFLHSAHTSPAIDSVETTQSTFGYDGQFYFMIAADPAHAHDYMNYAPQGHQAGRRYARILYPMASRVAAAGQTAAIPWVMLIVNLLAIGAGTWAVGLWLQRHGRAPYYAVLYGLWPGMIFTVFRDLSEPLAYCLAAIAVLVFDRRRVWVACALLALALLARETAIAFAVAGAVALWLEDRRWRRPLAFAAAAIAPMVVWRVIVYEWLRASPLESAGGARVIIPFYGMRAWWPWDAQHRLIALTADLPLLLAAVGGLYLLYRRRALPSAVLLLLNVALFVVWIPKGIVIDWGAAGRNVAPALLGFLYCIPYWRNRATLLGLSALLSPLWFLFVAWLLGLPGLDLMTT